MGKRQFEEVGTLLTKSIIGPYLGIAEITGEPTTWLHHYR